MQFDGRPTTAVTVAPESPETSVSITANCTFAPWGAIATVLSESVIVQAFDPLLSSPRNPKGQLMTNEVCPLIVSEPDRASVIVFADEQEPVSSMTSRRTPVGKAAAAGKETVRAAVSAT